VLHERERDALVAELARWDGHVSSALLRVEAIRACARYGDRYAAAAGDGLGGVSLIPVDDEVLEAAARLVPAELRSLDALHLATALSLGDDVGVLVAYDERLIAAAAAQDVPVAVPR
jgi:predicted nucleic acid-binding protein